MTNIATEAVVNRGRVHERVNIEVARSRADEEVAAVRREIRFSLISPDRVESFADDVFADYVPIPLGGVGVRGVDIRAGAVVRKAICGSAVGKMLEPAIFQDCVVVSGLFREARPNEIGR